MIDARDKLIRSRRCGAARATLTHDDDEKISLTF